VTHQLIELGGPADGRPLLLAPANSFPVASYAPVWEPFLDRYRVLGLALAGVWPNPAAPPTAPASWVNLGESIAATIARYDLEDVIAVGHSFGAVASLVAVARHPDRFRALCLLDPTMVLADDLHRVFFFDAGGERQHRLAVRARERRTEFGSEGEAYESWRTKPLFQDWSDETLRRFVRTALRPVGNGAGFTLAWPAEWEAHYYEGFHEESWAELERLDPAVPVLVVRGEKTDAFTARAAARFRAIRPSATMVEVTGFGHLFPQTAPEETARVVQAWLEDVGG